MLNQKGYYRRLGLFHDRIGPGGPKCPCCRLSPRLHKTMNRRMRKPMKNFFTRLIREDLDNCE